MGPRACALSKLDLVVIGDQIISHDLDEDQIEQIKEQYQEDALKVIVDRVKAKRSPQPEPGFVNEKDTLNSEDLDYDYLKSLLTEEYNPKRELMIYTWGKRLKKNKPQQSQCNFNASILNGRAGGIDLKNNNGLYLPIQKVVSRCSAFEKWISMTIKKIESNDLKIISINCAKGRHRSVAAAEILRKVYYPSAKVIHLTIY